MADIEALIAPVSEEEPAGPNMEYDPRRGELERMFEAAGTDEGESVDWREVVRSIVDQSALTKDIWLPVYLARAGARAGDLGTVEQGCAYMAALCDNFWDTMHPSVAEYGLQARRTACESLASIGGFLRPFREVVLLEHPRLGRFTAEAIENFATDGEAAEGYGMFRAALDDLPEEELQSALERIAAIRDSLQRVDATFTERAEGEGGVNFDPVYAVLDSVRRAVATFAGGEQPEEPQGDEAVSPAASDAAGGGASVPGKINSRADVVRAIDAAIDYFRRNEPASPVPVALTRAKAWIGMDFLSILEDIAPDSIGDARRVLISQQGESE